MMVAAAVSEGDGGGGGAGGGGSRFDYTKIERIQKTYT